MQTMLFSYIFFGQGIVSVRPAGAVPIFFFHRDRAEDSPVPTPLVGMAPNKTKYS